MKYKIWLLSFKLPNQSKSVWIPYVATKKKAMLFLTCWWMLCVCEKSKSTLDIELKEKAVSLTSAIVI